MLSLHGWDRLVRFAGLVWMILFMAGISAPPTWAQEQEDEGYCSALTGEDVCITEATYRADVCAAIAAYANHWSLPEGFLARLIWQESRFDPAALSPAGAQGIAQFMPATGRLRELHNPFDPAEALARSAQYLRFLELKFGNLGLAAAAYNGGEGRMGRYVANGGGALPSETRNYVMIVTGHPVSLWLNDPPEAVDYALARDTDFLAGCIDMASSMRKPNLTTSPAHWQPWGVLIAQSPSAELASARFGRVMEQFAAVIGSEELMLISARNPAFGNTMRFSAMIGRADKSAADALCRQLLTAGGNCIVQKNQ